MNDIEKEIVLLKHQEEETQKECAKERDRYAQEMLGGLGESMKEFLKEDDKKEEKREKQSNFFKRLIKVLG